ncbi:hypothetical protein ACRRTK_022946 [Alexandromys fortis]
MEIETETHTGALDQAPKVPMRNRRRENMSMEVRTMRGAPIHRDSGADLLGANQGQLECD